MTRLFTRRVIVAAGAVLLATTEFIALRTGAGVDVTARVGDSAQPVTVGAVAVAAAVAALAGWGLLALLERATRRARPVWTAVAVVVLLLSIVVGPWAGGVDRATQATLALLHLSVGTVLILGLPVRPGRHR